MQQKPRFGPLADLYSAFRPAHPQALFDRILEALPEQNRKRAMDLGAGTGLSALPLCRWFAEVIAVEPDPGMAAKLTGRNPRLVVRITTAEECAQEPESVDLVTSGNAFYWMDGPRVLANVLRWLRPAGLLAVYYGFFPRTPEKVHAIVWKELDEHWRPFRHQRLWDEGYSRRTIAAASGFSVARVLAVPNTLQMERARFVGYLRSTSYGSAYAKTLPRPDAYWKQLETSIRKAWPDAMIPVDFELELILARKG